MLTNIKLYFVQNMYVFIFFVAQQTLIYDMNFLPALKISGACSKKYIVGMPVQAIDIRKRMLSLYTTYNIFPSKPCHSQQTYILNITDPHTSKALTYFKDDVYRNILNNIIIKI